MVCMFVWQALEVFIYIEIVFDRMSDFRFFWEVVVIE